ncbi:MAG: hypothetical protein NWQ31_13125 [Polaribacter sp.]|nr:hypothetical protein [Polaribacter sp.]
MPILFAESVFYFKSSTNKVIKVSSDFACKIINTVIYKAAEYTNQIKKSIDKSEN